MNKKYNELSEKPSLLKSLPSELVTELQRGLYEGRPLVGEGGILTSMIKELVELSLQGEMDNHLTSNSLEEGGNRRNGLTHKSVKSSVGKFELNALEVTFSLD